MNLAELGRGVYALIHPHPVYGNSNVGVVIDTDGLTFVDTTATPESSQQVLANVAQLTAGLGSKLKRVLLTSSRTAFTGGSETLWQAAFYGSKTTSGELDMPVNLDALRRLLPTHADAYHDRFQTRPITHEIETPCSISPATEGLVVQAESATNLICYVASADVLYAGAVASFGVTPLAFDGYPGHWAETLRQIAELASTVVPGHGQIGGRQDLLNQASYFEACIAAQGNPDKLPSGPWESWTNQEFHPINIERAHRLSQDDERVPETLLSLLGLG